MTQSAPRYHYRAEVTRPTTSECNFRSCLCTFFMRLKPCRIESAPAQNCVAVSPLPGRASSSTKARRTSATYKPLR